MALMYVGPVFTAPAAARVWSPATPAGKHLAPRLLNVPPCLHVSSLQLIGASQCCKQLPAVCLKDEPETGESQSKPVK